MTDQRRGKKLAVAGLIVQGIMSVALYMIWQWTWADSAWAAMWFMLVGLPLWLVVMLLFYCRQLAAREAQELDEIAARGGAQGTIFERAEGLEQRPAAKRMVWMEKWLAPIFTLLWAGIMVGLILIEEQHICPIDIYNAGSGAVLLILLAMVCFLFSYYCLGMAREEQWRMLRAAGSYMLVGSLLIGAAGVALLLSAWKGLDRVDDYVEYTAPFLAGLLAVELVLNFILDLYRPRVPGQEHRFSFDSRLFNVIAEPGKVGHSIAETMNYQFGFEVSRTWFYQLISRAAVPLLLTAAAIMLAMSCVVVVRQGESYVLRRWGRIVGGQAGEAMGPGLHFKLPWPVETAERFATGDVHQVLLGVDTEHPRSEAEIIALDYVNGLEVFDWSKSHGEYEERDFIIAVPPREERDKEKEKATVPVNIIKLVMAVQYRIRNIRQYGYEFADPQKMLECLAYRELTQYFATATLDSPVPGGVTGRPEAIMTYGKTQAAAQLKARVQALADKLKLGIDITFVGFLGIHPPPEAAKAFEGVLQAQRSMEQKRYDAEADSARLLSNNAGSTSSALRLALAIQEQEELSAINTLRAEPQKMLLKRDEYILAARDRVAALDAEIEQERIEGRLKPDSLSDRQQLKSDNELYLGRLEALKSPEDVAARLADATRKAGEKFDRASGEVAAMISKEEGYRLNQAMRARAAWESFGMSLAAFQACPSIYQWDRWLSAWEETLPNLPKFVEALDRKNLEVRMDLTRQPSALEGAFDTTPKPKEK